MQIRYNAVMPLLLGTNAAIMTLLFFLRHRSDRGVAWLFLALAVALLFACVGYALKPAAVVEGDELVLRALLGPAQRRYPLSALEVHEGRIYHVAEGKRRKVLDRWIVRREDYETLAARVAARG
jgi:hypothetical protein